MYGELDSDSVRGLFTKYKSDFGRSYESEEEEVKRFDVFKLNLKHIDSLNYMVRCHSHAHAGERLVFCWCPCVGSDHRCSRSSHRAAGTPLHSHHSHHATPPSAFRTRWRSSPSPTPPT